MTREEIMSLAVGSLLKYSDSKTGHTDMGLLSEVIEVGEARVRVYRVIWTSNPKRLSSESPSSLRGSCFTLIQSADSARADQPIQQ